MSYVITEDDDEISRKISENLLDLRSTLSLVIPRQLSSGLF